MKKFSLILEIIGLLSIFIIVVFVLPPFAKNVKYNAFLEGEVAPYKDDSSQYLPIISAINNVVYKEEPLFTLNLEKEGAKIGLETYLIASANQKEIVDGIYFFINSATYENYPYMEISLNVIYDGVVRKEKGVSYNNVYKENTLSNDALRGFYVSPLTFEGEKRQIVALEFGVNISKTWFTNSFLLISNYHNANFIFNYPLSEINKALKDNPLSSIIKDPRNIPTNYEKYLYKIAYNPFDYQLLESYSYYTWAIYYIYLIISIIFIHLIYLKPLIDLFKSEQKEIKPLD